MAAGSESVRQQQPEYESTATTLREHIGQWVQREQIQKDERNPLTDLARDISLDLDKFHELHSNTGSYQALQKFTSKIGGVVSNKTRVQLRKQKVYLTLKMLFMEDSYYIDDGKEMDLVEVSERLFYLVDRQQILQLNYEEHEPGFRNVLDEVDVIPDLILALDRRILEMNWRQASPAGREALLIDLLNPTQTTSCAPNNDVPHNNGCEPADLKREEERRKTFIDWPKSFMSPDKFAKAGFYSMRSGDTVRCAFCGIYISSWQEGNDPMIEHLRLRPNCPFVNKMDVGNVTLGQEDRPPTSENGSRKNHPSLETKSTGPLWKLYGTMEERLRSFAVWPVALKRRPFALADAGFYYTGTGDQTTCFHCGGGLKDWVDSDDPWTKHALWFPTCAYVMSRKGMPFIEQVLAGKEAIDVESSSSAESLPNETNAYKSPCKICLQEELGVVFIPCGHLVACVKCALLVSVCPVCRAPFTATQRVYLA